MWKCLRSISGDLAKGEAMSPLIDRKHATQLLGTMMGGYNVETLVALLDDSELAETAADGLCKTLLMFHAFPDAEEKVKAGNAAAKRVIESWANAQWFEDRPEVPAEIKLTVFKVPGETNTDDLSPAVDFSM